MKIVIFGAAGFVGLNITQTMLARGHAVVAFDRRPLPPPATRHFAEADGTLEVITGDVTDLAAVKAAVGPGTDIVIMGAAITAGSAREARDPASILEVNLLAQLAMLEAARDAGARRVINLSSVAAYGLASGRESVLDEMMPGDPVGLYPITKWASERIGARLGSLWGLDVVSLRLSGVFGPWEHDSGVRDTLSPQCQVFARLQRGETALLTRPGLRDWIYAVDVAEAVLAVATADRLPRNLYNVSSGAAVGAPFSVLDWGVMMAHHFRGSACRLTGEGETANIDLFGPTDRAPMATAALADDIGWRARFGVKESVAHMAAWLGQSGAGSAV